MTELIGFHSLELQSLIQSFEASSAAPKPYRDLFRNLALDSPVCGMLHPGIALRHALEAMQSKDPKTSPDILEELQVQLPMIFKLVSSLDQVPKPLIDLLQSLLDLAESSYPSPTSPSQQEVLESCSLDASQFKDSFFPALSPVRSRGIYEMDLKHGKKEQSCTKHNKGHPSLLPGVFCLFCEHGICYGYQLMDCHESPNVPFTLLLTRFKKAPSIVIYDNACKLHTYCLNRYPDFFKDSWFLVDRLHWFNHSGCNTGYNLNDYPQFKTLNSQAAEQGNSSLGKLKSMLSYMTNENFHLHCRFYLWVLNYRKQKK